MAAAKRGFLPASCSPFSRISSRLLLHGVDRPPPRPSHAPKPVLDVKRIREDPTLYERNCRDRNYAPQAAYPSRIASLHAQWQNLQHQTRSLRERRNALRTALSHAKTFSGIEATPSASDEQPRAQDASPTSSHASDREGLLDEARLLKEQLSAIEADESRLTTEIESLALALPNLTSAETPIGSEPKVIEYVNEHPEATTTEPARAWASHAQIGHELDILDFAAARAASGWGWYFLKHDGAQLEQALVQYALAVARRHGCALVRQPSVVRRHVAAACGFQPRDTGGETQVYGLEGTGDGDGGGGGGNGLCLAGTAEIPLAALQAGAELDAGALPLRVVGASRCYRAEAGSYGVETKGLFRVHEFTKVELFGWTRPTVEAATALFDGTVAIQKEILGALGLHCRVLEQPSYDLGASATRKRDIEAWFPSRRERNEGWGEVTSASICTDYQTRRLGTRVRGAGGTTGPRTAFPYTVNGTAVAVPRVLAAILENHWDEERRCVRVPEVLRPWMGTDTITKKR